MRAPTLDPPRSPAWEEARRAPVDADGPSPLFGYVAVRLTGLMLSVLVLGHFAVTHFVNDVAGDDSAFVARRLSSTLWIAWDGTMLAAALAHGAFGARLAIADYARSARARRRWEWALAAAVVALFALGLTVIARAARA